MSSKQKIIKLNQWKARAQLADSAASVGWKIKNLDLTAETNQVSFYFCEPLKTQFTSIAVFNRSDVVKLIKDGVKKYANKMQIMKAAIAISQEVIEDKLSDKDEKMKLMMFANLLYFITSQTAVQGMENNFKHFGIIMYDNSHGDVIDASMRPIALDKAENILEPGIVGLSVCNYMAVDYENHPEFFKSIDLESAMKSVLINYPDFYNELF
jgi:hypothetical protein